MGNLSGLGAVSANGTITFSGIGGTYSGTRIVQVDQTGVLSSLADGSNNQLLSTDGSGNLTWVNPPSGNITGSGTATRVAFWDGATSLSSNSNLYWENSNSRLGVGTASPSTTLHVSGATTLAGTVSVSGNVTGTGSPTLSGFGTINGATLSGGTLSGGTVSGGSLSGGTYTATGYAVAGNYTATIGGDGSFAISDGSNTLFTLTDSGTTGTLAVSTINASNIGAFTLTGNITGSGSPTLSGIGTINGATLSGGTLSGGTFSGGGVSGGSLTGGTYAATGSTVAGNYTATIGNTGSNTLTSQTAPTHYYP